MNYAGFGKRLLAYLIDGVIIGLAGGILAVFFRILFYLILDGFWEHYILF